MCRFYIAKDEMNFRVLDMYLGFRHLENCTNGPQLTMVGLTMFLLHNGEKAIHIQWIPYSGF